MASNLSELNHQELRELEKKLAAEFKKRESTRLKEARVELKEVERKYGLTIEQIVLGRKNEGNEENLKSEPKYRNPDNPEQVWSGRGKKPSWFTEAIDSGKTKESLSI